jgi:hypothetical protein
MQAKMMVAAIALSASAASAAPMSHLADGKAQTARAKPCCPMCSQMMQRGQKMSAVSDSMQGGMMKAPMMGRLQATETTPTVTVAYDGSFLVLRGGTLYKYSADLKLLGSVKLPAAAPASAMDMNMAPSAGQPGK